MIYSKHLNKAEIKQVFVAAKTFAKIYHKIGEVTASSPKYALEIVTLIEGQPETKNTHVPGKTIVVTNHTESKESYVLPLKKFYERYSFTRVENNEFIFSAKGAVLALRYEGPSITFEPPWGGTMMLNYGDMLCQNPDDENDIYRIAAKEFYETYR